MKRLASLLAVCIIGVASSALAVDLTFQWDPNTESDLAGYRLFQRTSTSDYDYGNPTWDGMATEVTHSFDEMEKVQYFWVLRAYDTSNNESGNSNEVTWIAPDVTPPANPKGLVLESIDLAMQALQKLKMAINIASF